MCELQATTIHVPTAADAPYWPTDRQARADSNVFMDEDVPDSWEETRLPESMTIVLERRRLKCEGAALMQPQTVVKKTDHPRAHL